MCCFRPVLSYEVVSYLTFEGVNLCEELESVAHQASDLKPCLRRMHLVSYITIFHVKF
jgi:timeless protein